jgi:hypothetical protein
MTDGSNAQRAQLFETHLEFAVSRTDNLRLKRLTLQQLYVVDVLSASGYRSQSRTNTVTVLHDRKYAGTRRKF